MAVYRPDGGYTKNKNSPTYGTGPSSGASWDPVWNASGIPASPQNYAAFQQTRNQMSNAATYSQNHQQSSAFPNYASSGGGGGGGGRRGGGGGGGGGKPGIDQTTIDWVTQLLSGRPQQQTFTPYTPPEWQSFTPAAFDTSMYDKARTRLGEAYQGDVATAQGATANMNNYLTSNYTNAYANMPQQQGGDMSSLVSLLGGQGVDSTNNPQMQQAAQGAGAANQGFANLWATLGANENMAQRNRLTANQQYGQDALNRLQAQNSGLGAGIDISQGQGQQQYNQGTQQMAYQDWLARQQSAQQAAQGNWQQQNLINQGNVSGANDWRSTALQTILGLIGQTAPGVTMPDLSALGF